MKDRNTNEFKTAMTGLLLFVIGLLSGCSDDPSKKVEEPGPVTKSNPMKIYMHYMPWFQSKPVSGYWGYHWTMTNKNPEIIENGKRQIAAHYYPLIGAYDSKDPDVLEYHLLLMKYAGVDAVLFDWYGSQNVNDYRAVLTGTNAAIDKVDDVGLDFAIVYEDYTAGIVEDKTSKTAMKAAQEDMAYLQTNYLTNKKYLKVNDGPVLMTFGPRYFKSPAQWTEIFSVLTTKPKFLPLWNHTAYTGTTDNGEYSWVDFNSSLSDLTSFYMKKSHVEILMGSAYPRFHDFYVEGGAGQSYGNVPFNNGETLQKTLDAATAGKADYLQLVTWNDFGEGTVIEPTTEDEFKCLQIIQGFTGVSYGLSELQMIHEYYLKKVKYKNDAESLTKLKTVFEHLSFLRVDEARTLLKELE